MINTYHESKRRDKYQAGSIPPHHPPVYQFSPARGTKFVQPSHAYPSKRHQVVYASAQPIYLYF